MKTMQRLAAEIAKERCEYGNYNRDKVKDIERIADDNYIVIGDDVYYFDQEHD